MSVETILSRLDKLRNAGEGSWRSPCPVHVGKNFNMSIKECSDGTVIAHCFVCGANGIQLAEALGLPKSELFPAGNEYARPVVSKKMEQQAFEDKMVLDIANTTERLTLSDKRRIRLAKARLEGIQKLKNIQ